ncbi:DMT family transporter [Kocuria dechangensis]|uniref:DMT family transporter n=1 Tax=Kocuria dechangensis TaxID=1176249 RepID=UPI001E3D2B23|nr:DMT family transporter [Kocuria dechangensis]
MPARTVLALVAATLFWAGNYVVGALAVESMSPVAVTYWRWVIAAVPLLVIAQVVERPDWGAVWRDWPVHLGLSVSGMIAYTVFLYEALRHTSAIDASLINAATPAVIAVCALLLFRDRIGPRTGLGIVVGLSGVVTVLTGGRLGAVLGVKVNLGNALMLGAVAVWSLYTLLGRRLSGSPPIASTAVQAGLAVVLLTPVALWAGVRWPQGTAASASLVFIGLFPSVGSYLLWNMAVRRVPAGRAGVFLNLITVFVVVFSLVLGESLSWAQAGGGALVFSGIALVTSEPARARAREKVSDSRARPSCPTGS